MKFTSIPKNILSLLFRGSVIGFSRDTHLTRYFMYQHIAESLTALINRPSEKRVLSISHFVRLCQLLGMTQPEITEANYPEVNMLDLPFKDSLFDYVVSDQVLEHIEGDPQKAMDESWRVLKPGGIAIHTTCFMNEIHGAPSDFWRFTPNGLRLLCARFSKVLDACGWGNSCAAFLMWLGLRNLLIPRATWHPLSRIATMNNDRIPIVTWIIAQK